MRVVDWAAIDAAEHFMLLNARLIDRLRFGRLFRGGTTDAVLTAMDRLTLEHPHVITVATSNFVGSLDEAFRSRADAAIEVQPIGGDVGPVACDEHDHDQLGNQQGALHSD